MSFKQKPPLGTPINWSHPQLVGLVGWWLFQEGSGDKVYDLVNKLLGTLNGFSDPASASSGWNAGKLGRTLAYDGAGDFINILPISIATNITIAAWVYSSDYDTEMMVVMKKPVNEQWQFFFEGTTHALSLMGGDTTRIEATLPANELLHHVAATIAGTTGTIYIDGVEAATGAVTTIGNGTTPVTNDILISTYDGVNYPFDGLIDDVRIYDRVLTAAEIMDIFSDSFAMFMDTQQKLWKYAVAI